MMGGVICMIYGIRGMFGVSTDTEQYVEMFLIPGKLHRYFLRT